MKRKGRVLYCCEATEQTGLGHVMRSLGLAEAMQETGWSPVFAGRFEPAVETLIGDAGFACERLPRAGDATDVERMVMSLRARAVVVDSYSVDHRFLDSLSRVPLLLIDDFAALDAYPCSVVVNFTLMATEFTYPDDGARYLLGPRYLLVRRCLRATRDVGEREVSPEPANVLIAMGGTDAENLTEPVVQAFMQSGKGLVLTVVTGPANPHRERLCELLGGTEHQLLVLAPDMSSLLSEVDVCVCGGGLTKYESVYLGIPTAVISKNRGEECDTRHFADHGLVLDCGSGIPGQPEFQRLLTLIEDLPLRRGMVRRGLDLFDGDPTARVARHFEEAITSFEKVHAVQRSH